MHIQTKQEAMEKLAKDVEKAFQEMIAGFKPDENGKHHTGIAEICLSGERALTGGARFTSRIFTDGFNYSGLEFGFGFVPKEVAYTFNVPFRAEIKTKQDDPSKYLAIMWLSDFAEDEYIAFYSTNDADYATRRFRTTTEICWGTELFSVMGVEPAHIKVHIPGFDEKNSVNQVFLDLYPLITDMGVNLGDFVNHNYSTKGEGDYNHVNVMMILDVDRGDYMDTFRRKALEVGSTDKNPLDLIVGSLVLTNEQVIEKLSSLYSGATFSPLPAKKLKI
jgi:hypothetical protein